MPCGLGEVIGDAGGDSVDAISRLDLNCWRQKPGLL